MGDNKAGAPFHSRFEGHLDFLLCSRVHRTGGFVQDKHGRFKQHGPRYGKKLLFSLRKVFRRPRLL